MPSPGTCKCLNCFVYFNPNPRSKGRQKYCSHADCQKASKRASQRKWLQKPQNQDYFRCPENVQRVQQWRNRHPGYSKSRPHCSGKGLALQDPLIPQVTEKHHEIVSPAKDALQEILIAQPVVLIGLIAHLTGSTLQDEIVRTGRKLRELGEDFLSKPNQKGENDDLTSVTQPPTITANSTPL